MFIPTAEQNVFVDEESVSWSEEDPARLVKERLIGVSRWVKEARGAVAAHAAHDHPIILDGEPGAGKEFLARLIHDCSARRHGPFVTIACGLLSEESLEAALFGSIQLLPSGRNRIQRGLVEVATGGTLYIDGISSLSSILRVEITRLIQHQEFRRRGDNLLESADVRVILGYLQNQEAKPAETVTAAAEALSITDILSLPPLRRRKADIEPLSRHFVTQACQRFGKEPRMLPSETMTLLRRYEWPGNISELKHAVEEMVRQSKPPALDPSSMPAHLARVSYPTSSLPDSGIDLNEEVKRFEHSLLCEVLKRCQGQQTRAARLLGLKLTTLNAKIARYGIDVTLFKRPR
jgi:DNA-binding NtrC family response regulator